MSFLVGENMTGGYGGADILHNCTIGVEKGEIAVVVVISNWTGRPVFFCTIMTRSRIEPLVEISSMRSRTKSQPRSLLSIATLNRARSRKYPASSSRARIAQTCFGNKGRF